MLKSVVHRVKLFLHFIGILCALVLVGYACFWLYIDQATDRYIYSVSQIPGDSYGLVLGAQAYTHEIPSPALAYRLDTAVQLLKNNKVSHLILSGDGRAQDYNEITTMRNYLKSAGVTENILVDDSSGLRTYDSCYRAKNVYHLDSVTIVTQRQHLKRAIYTCRSLGINAVGVPAAEFEGSGAIQYEIREQAALVRAWLDVHFLHPTPTL